MRILLLNLGPESTQEVTQALSGQGYELTTGRRLTVDKILALSPEVLITEATPSDLSCCGVISQLKAEVVRLNGGILQQGELLRRAEQARASLTASDASGTRESLKVQTAEIRKKIAADGDTDSGSLKKQLQETQNRLNRLENEGRVAETIVHRFGPSVCLLHVVVEFRDKDSGQLILISSDAAGKPLVDDKGMVSLETEGTGAPLQVDAFGTGFLVAHDGRLLTNHHVAEPWWGDEELKQLIDRGATAFAASYT